jgi:hypothetical protein
MRPDGVCLSYLSDACKLPFDIVAAAVMELEEAVKVTAHGTCPECGEGRLVAGL